MKTRTRSLSGVMLLILSASFVQAQEHQSEFRLDGDDISFVIIEVKLIVGEDASSQDLYMHDLIDHLKSINTELQTIKKFSSLRLDDANGGAKFLAIRPFEDFKSAEQYANSISKHIDSTTFTRAGEPFPISQLNYRTCVVEKDFGRYQEFYHKTGR